MIANDSVLKFADAYSLDVDLVRGFLNLFKDRVYIGSDVIAVYCMLDDFNLEMLRYCLFDITNGDEVIRLLKMNGDNVHFFGAVGSLRGLLSMRCIKAKSFSWFTPNLEKFVYFKRG